MKPCIALEGGSGFFNSVGKLGLCCNDSSHGNREDHFILDYNERKEFLKNKSLTWDDFRFCNYCKQNEENGYQSTRQIINQKGRFELTVSVGNVCNLRCAMCRPDSSYLLSQDISALPEELASMYPVRSVERYSLTPKHKDDIENFIASIDDQEVEINVLGGEPLSDSDLVDWILGLLDKFSHLADLQVTTNLTYNTKKTMALAENPRVRIAASVEGFGDSYEWGRFGVKWDTVAKNLINFHNVVGNRMHVHSVIHAISVLGDQELSNFLKENKIRHDKALLESPNYMHLKVLNQKERDILNLTDVAEYDENLRNLFVKYMLSLEKTRKKPMPESITTFFGINRDN